MNNDRIIAIEKKALELKAKRSGQRLDFLTNKVSKLEEKIQELELIINDCINIHNK